MTLAEAQALTLKVLKDVMEEKLDKHNVQLAQVKAMMRLRTAAKLLILGDTQPRLRDLK
jgi:hypothetical protein